MKYSVELAVPAAIENSLDGIKIEDSGQALVLYGREEINEEGGDGCLYVQLVSYDEDMRHPLMHRLLGRRIRITIETLDEEGENRDGR